MSKAQCSIGVAAGTKDLDLKRRKSSHLSDSLQSNPLKGTVIMAPLLYLNTERQMKFFLATLMLFSATAMAKTSCWLDPQGLPDQGGIIALDARFYNRIEIDLSWAATTKEECFRQAIHQMKTKDFRVVKTFVGPGSGFTYWNFSDTNSNTNASGSVNYFTPADTYVEGDAIYTSKGSRICEYPFSCP